MTRAFTVRAHSGAPVDRVWELLANAASWPSWAPMMRSMRYERDGSPTRDGVGAVRFFGVGPVGSREEVTAFEPPGRFAYRMLSGLPVSGYRSVVTLDATPDGGCTITWSSQWDAAWPAPFWHWCLQRLMQRFARRLAVAAAISDGAGRAARRPR